MEEKTKAILWLVICGALLVALVYLGYLWIDTANTLKQPCVVCSMRNNTFGNCLKQEQETNPFLIKINWTEIQNENGASTPHLTPNNSKNDFVIN